MQMDTAVEASSDGSSLRQALDAVNAGPEDKLIPHEGLILAPVSDFDVQSLQPVLLLLQVYLIFTNFCGIFCVLLYFF